MDISVVVHDDDHVGAGFGCIAQPFEGFPSAEGAVAYDGDDVSPFAFQVAGLGQSTGQAHRG